MPKANSAISLCTINPLARIKTTISRVANSATTKMSAVNHQPPSHAVSTVGKKTNTAPILRRDNELLFSKRGLELLATMAILPAILKNKTAHFCGWQKWPAKSVDFEQGYLLSHCLEGFDRNIHCLQLAINHHAATLQIGLPRSFGCIQRM